MSNHSSSDEEDDHTYLIENKHRDSLKSQSPRHHSPHRSSFQIDEIRTRFSNSRSFNFNKWYFFAILLPILIILLFFITDIKSMFQSSVSGFNYDASLNKMREAELRAVYLLKQQNLGLIKLFNNYNNSNNNNNSLGDSSRVGVLEDLRSDLVNQISLNNEIQKVLLSSHRVENSFGLEGDSDVSGGGGWNRCRKVDLMVSGRRTIEWKPSNGKYLFAICTSGQMSNRLICLEKHMFFAAVLNRVLVIPSSKVDYEFKRVLDIEHINKCLGRKVVVTFEEFAESKKSHLHIDRFVCYFSLPQPCYADDDHVKKLKSLGVSMSKIESAWVEDVKKPSQKTMKDVIEKFSLNDDVIAIGDVFFADVEKDWVMQPGGPIAHQCKTLIEPSRLILLTAQRFVQTFLGENFVALHFRRHGFLKFCNAKTPSCFYPVPQAAECITRIVERTNAPVIYLSTDAAESETDLLQSLVLFNGKTVPLVKRPARNSAEKWDALLYRAHIEGDSQVEAMLDKTICALSSAFVGASGSTFTEDILRLRKDWGSASLCDEYLCQGELPNFVAEDEDAH
ncbi:glycosyltransferase [Lithospermum erythrorhizon]|uniref:GDP-fucose protein O-fucosyltransferase 2 n=1 Tax=Lithospermum erythrorhizon TaxID=34254 RepID=A0AAV3PPJ5_LITER